MFVNNLFSRVDRQSQSALNYAVDMAKLQSYFQVTLDHIVLALTEQDTGLQHQLRAEGVNIESLQQSLKSRLESRRPRGMPHNQIFSLPLDRIASEVMDKASEGAGESPLTGRQIIEAVVAHAPDSETVMSLRMNGYGNPEDAPKRRQVEWSVVTREAEEESPDWHKYVTDITALAEKGALQPVIGRETEIARMAQIANRVKKNNPLLIGEPGVGKTEMVNGFATYMWQNRDNADLVSADLHDAHIMTLDMGALTAGAKHIGEFQERMKKVLEGVKNSPFPVMMFIDEIHTLIGAGAQAGGLDAANMLKPALANGALRCIGATTYNEYQKYIMTDAALERRFMIVRAEEPDFAQAAAIAYGLIGIYEKKHKVSYGLTAENHIEIMSRAAKLSKMMPGRFLPDCLLDLIDEAGVRNRGQDITFDHYIDAIAGMTGLPAHTINDDNVDFYLELGGALKKRIFWQDEAVDVLAAAVLRQKMGLSDPEKPAGSFLFLGPTGNGKTALAKALAENLFGETKKHFLRIDMSEFKDKHSVYRLFGAPPGYVGYEEGGALTEFVRRNPYAVILLDEIEKAHPDVYESLYQVLDAARMTDGKGRIVDFSHSYVIMTSNATADGIKKSPIGFQGGADAAAKPRKNKHKELAGIFNNAFLGRVDDVMTFAALTTAQMTPIVGQALAERNKWLNDKGKNYGLYATPAAGLFIAEHRPDPEEGARSIGKYIKQHIDTPVAFARATNALPKGGLAYIDVNPGKTALTLDFNRTALVDLPALLQRDKAAVPAPL